MPWKRLLHLVWQNIARNKVNFVFSSVGILIGTGMFTFFVGLGEGIRTGVLNRIYPINQIEVEPKTVTVLGVKETLDDVPLTDQRVASFREVPGVASAYPKQRSKFQARLWGGQSLFGRDVHTEAFFDGIRPELVTDELHENEGGRTDGRKKKRRLPCKNDGECGPGQECADGVCQDTQYWRLFADHGEYWPCATDDGCASGVCIGGVCRATECASSDACDGACVILACTDDSACGAKGGCVDGRCLRGYCAAACDPGDATGIPPRSTCAPHEWCTGRPCAADTDCGGPCVDGRCAASHVCEAIPCQITGGNDIYSTRPLDFRGRVTGVCADGSAPDADGACQVPLPCPERTYCQTAGVQTTTGQCEQPVPVVLSPFLVEMFNTTAATALGLRRVSETQALLGLGFRVQYGDSFFTDDREKKSQVVKRAQIVGFSSKALDLGVTMPLKYVERANARYKGTTASGEYDSVILEARTNEDVHQVTAAADRLGFELSRKSRDAKKAGNMLYILTVVFSLISWVIMVIAAVNISQTFLMVVYERKREIGVMRSIGATRGDIRRIVLVEAAFIGVTAGLLGNLVAWGASYGINKAAARYLADMPFRPETFFVFDPPMILVSIAGAIAFCLFGAVVPAHRAASLDPAEVLSQP
ncbi:MAG: hypothetical protein AMXMBFR64_27140 [Myxococcales bacterium]